MNIIIFGTEKCPETRKARRFFQERRIPVQFRNLGDKPLTEGELKNLCTGAIKAQDLVDDGGKTWVEQGFQWKEYDAAEAILDHPGLLKTPVIRIDRMVFVCPDLAKLPLGG
ncbi:MAG TPA: hypothetical protein PKH40_06615 [Treponemataceae bacterium]|jgi:arsenate reductase-like glutaredoxin family protein|nr:MAG: ArsC family transcriptional regulator [Treponema sp.]HOC29332.1 hypothetical protein [Treponemataceae bacterium]